MNTKTFLIPVLAAMMVLAACGEDDGSTMRGPKTAPTPLKKVLWLEEPHLTDTAAERLLRVGVDEIMVRVGSVRFSGDSPILQLTSEVDIAPIIPIGALLEVDNLPDTIERDHISALWGGLTDEFGQPAEIVIDHPTPTAATADLINLLKEVAGVPVLALIRIGTVTTEAGLSAATAAGTAVVPIFGIAGTTVDGIDDMAGSALDERLQAFADAGVRVRAAISLRPRTQPEIQQWGESLDGLCQDNIAELSLTSGLDRTFKIQKAVQWSGRDWSPGQTVAAEWVDAARLNHYIAEMNRISVPDLAGWDLISLPAPMSDFGISREAVIEYLGGRGPGPELELDVRRTGRRFEVNLINRSPFTTAVSAYDNWVEISIESGLLVVENRGNFDRVVLGTLRSGEWQALNSTSVDAVRFEETFIDGQETLRAGAVRLPRKRTPAKVKWHVILTTGDVLEGTRVFD